MKTNRALFIGMLLVVSGLYGCASVELEAIGVKSSLKGNEVCFRGLVKNVGGVDAQGPIDIIIGSTPVNFGPKISVQTPVKWNGTIGKNGQIIETEAVACQPMVANGEYWVDVIVDPENKIREVTKDNNRFQNRNYRP